MHGVTISRAQLEIAQRRMREQGLEDRVQLELRDYRDLDGQYDAVVSIEMFEAVGREYWGGFFARAGRNSVAEVVGSKLAWGGVAMALIGVVMALPLAVT